MGVGAVDKADPPVSQRQDRLAHFARRIPVVDNEAQAASQLKPRIDPREGQVPAFQYIENPVRVAQGRDEDDAVERHQIEKALQYRLRLIGVARGNAFDHQMMFGRAAGLEQAQDDVRSEEHTSELQSLMRTSYAVY